MTLQTILNVMGVGVPVVAGGDQRALRHGRLKQWSSISRIASLENRNFNLFGACV